MVTSDSELSVIEVGVAVLNGFKNCQKVITSTTVIAFGFTEGMAVVSNDSFSTVTHLRKYRSDTNSVGFGTTRKGKRWGRHESSP